MQHCQPHADHIHNVMQQISVGDPVDGRVDGQREEQDARKIAGPARDARDHLPRAKSLNQKDKRHY